MLGTESGGIAEALANLYARTGDVKYRDLSLRFNHRIIIDPLRKGVDALDGLHSNTQIPKLTGCLRQYELIGDESFYRAAKCFWENVVRDRTYVIGGNSNVEVFTPKKTFSRAIGPLTCETCNTYNMLKLTRGLFCLAPQAEYADYCERALLNHVLASQNPESGMMCYYVSLDGSQKIIGTPEDSFWCCYGTGIENHAKYGESIYFRNGDKTLYVNLFIASELDWRNIGLTLRQETLFPESDTSRFTFTCPKPVFLTLKIRHPYWATSGITIAVNGRKESVISSPGSYAEITKQWQTGDTLDVRMPMTIRTEAFRDDPRRLAILYGPVVLCGPHEKQVPPPTLVADDVALIPSQIRRSGDSLEFAGSPDYFRNLGDEKKNAGITLVPFFKNFYRPQIIYWDVLDEKRWKDLSKEREIELTEEKQLAARTIDRVAIGDTASEKSHRLQGEKHESGSNGGGPIEVLGVVIRPAQGPFWRHANNGGWFSYEMKTAKIESAELACTYWGGDTNGRTFDILINGKKLTEETLHAELPGRYLDRTYPIPADMIRGKEVVTVRFQAHPGNIAGAVFDCRILRKKTTR